MKYVSLDIETTGLDPEACQVLQIAAVLADTEDDSAPVDELPYFETLVHHPILHGTPTALRMNMQIVDTFSRLCAEEGPIHFRNREVHVSYSAPYAWSRLHDWVVDGNPYDHPITAAGKNVSGFDLKFMPDIYRSCFDYRTLEVGSFCAGARPELMGSRLPSLGKILDGEVMHDALEDARDNVRAIRKVMGQKDGE